MLTRVAGLWGYPQMKGGNAASTSAWTVVVKSELWWDWLLRDGRGLPAPL
jgi:hypothetical protein